MRKLLSICWLILVQWPRGLWLLTKLVQSSAGVNFSCQRILDTSPHHHRRHGSKHQPGVEE